MDFFNKVSMMLPLIDKLTLDKLSFSVYSEEKRVMTRLLFLLQQNWKKLMEENECKNKTSS